MIARPAERSAPTYEEAVAHARAIMACDTAEIVPNGRTALYDRGARTPGAVVLFHGLTNHPGQFAQFAQQLHARGFNVFVPRMPYHGYADRMTRAIAALTAEQLIAAAYESVDVASGLGERVAVLGISMGGLLCAHLAQYRPGVALSVPVAPDFGLMQMPRGVTSALGAVFRALPNMFMWWDPRVRAAQRPATAYPQFSTHALMQTVRIADDVYAAAANEPAKASKIVAVANAADPAVNNAAIGEVIARWKARRDDGVELVTYTDLPRNHDIIDPDNPLARTDLVYPRLLDLFVLLG